MIHRLRRLFCRQRPQGPRTRERVGLETRRLLESGERHLATAWAPASAEAVEESRGALESFTRAAKRRPESIEAAQGRALSLSALALHRLDAGESAPAEWVSATVLWGRVLSRDPDNVAAYAHRAALYLAMAAYHRALGKPAHVPAGEARKDLARAAERAPADACVRGLQIVLERVEAHEAGSSGDPPTVRAIRQILSGAVGIDPR